MTCVSLTGYSFHKWFPTSTKLLFQGGFNVNFFMSTCFVLTLSWGLLCVGAGWVICFGGVWGEYLWGRTFLLNLQANFTENVSFQQVFCILLRWITVGKGGHTPPLFFLRFSLFLEIQDVPTFHRSMRKAKVLNNSCNQLVYNSYPQSILILD